MKARLISSRSMFILMTMQAIKNGRNGLPKNSSPSICWKWTNFKMDISCERLEVTKWKMTTELKLIQFPFKRCTSMRFHGHKNHLHGRNGIRNKFDPKKSSDACKSLIFIYSNRSWPLFYRQIFSEAHFDHFYGLHGHKISMLWEENIQAFIWLPFSLLYFQYFKRNIFWR